MHELALMAELQRLAEAELQREGAQRIHRLQLRLGSLAGVDGEALRLAFAVLVSQAPAGSPWRGAVLDLETIQARCFCSDCDQPFKPIDMIHACPRCGRLTSCVLGGRELELASLEVS